MVLGYRACGYRFEVLDLAVGNAGVFVILENVDDGFATVNLSSNTFNLYGASYTDSMMRVL